MDAGDSRTDAWRVAISTFETLVSMPPAERAARLATLAGEQPALHAQVAVLLEADARAAADGFLAAGALADAGFGEPREPQEPRLRAGRVIGGRVLERPLGRGGMGEVWLATALADGPEAAVKVLHPHLSTPVVRERFAREGRILASLEHPNVARLIDAGGGPDGLLYLALEYVPGERIDRWCDDRRLDVEARLALFLQVCDAVAHAHSRLVLHRDLKPPNILVTPDGRVKLLDFGIAKLVERDREAADATELTLLGGRALTPDYAAPEQVAGGPATTATDVHALGVLLHLLLCGRRPFGGDGLTRAEVESAVLNVEPPSPSESVTDGEAAAALAARRATTPQRLRRRLRGDLDDIVHRSLRKDPAGRYPTAVALADDVRRHLRSEAIEARPPSFAYQASRLAARHRPAVIAVGVVALALVGGLAGAAWQAGAAREAARVAEQQRLRAERVRAFVISVFRDQDPFAPTAAGVGPAALVDRAVAKLDTELGAEPGLRAEVLGDLAEIRANVGDPAAGLPLAERALAERRAWYGEASPEAAATARALAGLRYVAGDVPAAARTVRDALERLDAAAPGAALEAARLKERLGFYLALGRGAPSEAMALVREAVAAHEAAFGPDHPETAVVLARYGQLLEQAREDDEAERVLRTAIERLQRRLGADAVLAWHPLHSLGAILARSERLEEAAATYARSAELLRRRGGGPDVWLSRVLVREADVQRQLGRTQAAFATYADAEAALPPTALDARSALLIQRGKLHLDVGDLAAAESDMGEAFRLRRRTLGEDNGLAWYTGSEWGRALARLGRVAEAESVQREALRRIAAQMGDEAYQLCLVLDALADTLAARGARGEVEAVQRRAHAIAARQYAPGHPIWEQRTRRLLAAMLASGTVRARPAEARAVVERWLAVAGSAPAAGGGAPGTPAAGSAAGPGAALGVVAARLAAGDGAAAERALRALLALPG